MVQGGSRTTVADRGDVPLLLLPGTLGDARLFTSISPRLGGRAATVVDFGDATDMRLLAQHILADAPLRFAVLGFSLGGMVGLEIAAQAPERVAGLALIGSSAREVPGDRHKSRRDEVRHATTAGVGRHVESSWWPSYVGSAHRDNDALRRCIIAMAEDAGAGAFASQTELSLSRADSRPRLAALDMPVLVIGGEEDTLCTPAMQRELGDALPDATLVTIPGAGHFSLLETPEIVAEAVADWLARVDNAHTSPDRAIPAPAAGGTMTNQTPTTKAGNGSAMPPADGAVLQVERRDFTQLVPENRARVQSMNGFDEIYTDIVDYIIRCTHRIWDERDVGLIYSHYTHNCVAYTTLGTMYDRETHIRDTIQRLVEFPDRRGMAQQVIWNGNDVDGFYTSHMTHGVGRHTEFGSMGKPTGRTFCTRTVADCMIIENRIYKEWIVRDNMGPLVQLGIDPKAYAATIARKKFDMGEPALDVSENRRLLGQYPPESQADVSIAHNDGEADLLRWLHHIYNLRMFGKIHEIYAPTCQWHGPLMRELYGIAAVLQQTMRLVALIPDGAFVPQHIASVESEEGGVKYAVRWTLDGRHLGYGPLGAPTGHKLFVMGVTHFHIRDGKIIDEWVTYDELSLLVQLQLAELQAAA
ncbi:MAG: alpha/beta fold hydrolase [Janthinobacterium lividum]